MKSHIIKHLKEKSPEKRWYANGMGDYLDSNRWKVATYEENKDVDSGDEINIRVYGLSGASADGKQSGQVRVVSDSSDNVVHSITPVMPTGKLSAAQHDFIALARGEAAWLMDVGAPESTHPDFGSW